MGNTERWWLIAHPNKPRLPVDIARDEDHARLMTEHDWTVFEVMPVEQLREVMQERDELRNMLIRVLDAVALLDPHQEPER